MEAPVCLVEHLQDGSLRVNAEAVEILSRIKQPLVVVAIVGMYRTGKSYLMNKLAGDLKGFELSAAVQAKTKGIWMWCVPHPVMEEKTLVLLDTEGLGDVQKGNSKNDLKIFCLSVLLSSVLIYNSRGTIDEDAVEKLRFVGELAELIKVKSEDNENNEGQFSRHFPAFIWVVRDFTLMLELEGKEITEDEYLENALLPQNLESTEETSKIRNQCRDKIRMYFNTRKCFVFDPPSADKMVLRRMDEVSDEELTPRFVAQCHQFCEYIYKNVEVKLLDDIKPVSGEILGQLVYKYTEAITSSTAVCMEDTVMSISEMENKAAVQEATEHYEKMMRERRKFPTETLEEFTELSAQCEEEALQIFIDKSFNDSELIFHAQFMRNIEEKKRTFSEMNEVESQNYCNQLIKKHSRNLEEALQQGLYYKPGGYQKFQEDMALIEERYNSEPRKGVEAESILLEFIQSKETVRISICRTNQSQAELLLKQEGDNPNTQLRKRENKLRELKLSNNGVIEESKKRSIFMHLPKLLKKAKNDNSKREERLDRVIQSKSMVSTTSWVW
ncbi:guanylate-binding protein 4-like [Lithobates pipiens]